MKTKQTHIALRARTVNAEDFPTPAIREKLFTPNAEKDSTYDLLADVQGTYILVAERGMGKTHILLVLEDQLEKRHDIVLHISPRSPEVVNTYLAIQEEYPLEKSSFCWQLAILEFIGLKLLDPSFGVRKKWLLLADKRTKVLVNYYRKYQPDELNYQIDHWMKQLRDTDKSSLTEFLISVETLFAKLTTSGKSRSEKKNDVKPTFSSRESLIEDWVWDAVKNLQTQKHRDGNHTELTKLLPKSKSVYVIADGLDQMDKIQNADLIGLVEAVKLLNEKSKIGLISDDANFKAVMALRAITYDYSIGPVYKHNTHLWGNIKRLSWDDSKDVYDPNKDFFLKKMMAKFIIAYSDNELNIDNIDQILGTVFPNEVSYFGRKFSPGTKFIFDYTERRPREILLLWQSASESADSGSLYSAKLTAQNLVDGLKKYSTSKLPEDIGTEYEIEFPKIKLLLSHLKDKRGSITRVLLKDVFREKIVDFIYSIPEDERPEWIERGFDNILKILFHVGIIGILPDEEHYDPDWPHAQYAADDPDKSLESSNKLVFRPAFWNYLTNIKTETDQTRLYILNLYRELQFYTSTLDELIDSISDADNTQKYFEMILGRFLVTCDLVERFKRYPEPSDWDVWNKVSENIKIIYDKFKNTPFCSNKVELDRMIATFRKVIMLENKGDFEEISFVSLENFSEYTIDNMDYRHAMRSTLKWLDGKQKRFDPEKLQKFKLTLMVGVDSFHSTLGEAISNVIKLRESRRSQ